MAAHKKQITHADILPAAEYAAKRNELRKQVVALKRNRRIEVGPVATFYFESFETMLQQIQEMLYIEKGGAEQIDGELAAYNPLIPNGKELIATVMFEIDDPIRRGRFLARLGGVEETAFFKLDSETVKGVPEADQDRTNADGKASSVQFVHFTFTPQQVALFREPNRQVVIGFGHPEYSHMAVVPEAVRAALSQDFD